MDLNLAVDVDSLEMNLHSKNVRRRQLKWRQNSNHQINKENYCKFQLHILASSVLFHYYFILPIFSMFDPNFWKYFYEIRSALINKLSLRFVTDLICVYFSVLRSILLGSYSKKMLSISWLFLVFGFSLIFLILEKRLFMYSNTYS